MILRITVGDNDFTEELENFAKDPSLTTFFCRTDIPEYRFNLDRVKKMDRFQQLFYQTDKYTPELANELVEMLKEHWEIFVKYIMPNHERWNDEDAERIKNYLIRDFKVKFQKSLTPREQNGEVVYICCGYYNRWWTF